MNETLKEVYRMIYNLDTGEYEGLRICLIQHEKLEEFQQVMDLPPIKGKEDDKK